MDRHQLFIIVLTAVISVTAKELLTWVLAAVKLSETSRVAREKVKRTFSKSNLTIMFDLVWLAVLLGLVIAFVRGTTQPTRMDILRVVAYSIGFVFWCIALMVDLITAKIRHAREREPAAPATTHQNVG